MKKKQSDYFNHFQSMGFNSIYKTPNSNKSTPKLDFIGYQFNSPYYNWSVSKESNPLWPKPDPFSIHSISIPFELRPPDVVVNNDLLQTNFLYNNYNVPDVDPSTYDSEVRRDGVFKTQFFNQFLVSSVGPEEPAGPWGNPTDIFPYELKRVMLKVRYLKNVYDINKIQSDIRTANGEVYTKEEFLSKFGNYLVPVRDDGEYIGITPYHKVEGENQLVRWGEDTTIKSIAIPIDDNNNFYTPKIINDLGYIEDVFNPYGLYTVENNGCLYPFLNLFGYMAGFYPSELAQISTFFPSSLLNNRDYNQYDNLKHDFELGNGGSFIQNPEEVEEDPETTEYAFNGIKAPSTRYYEYDGVDYTNRFGFWERLTTHYITFDYSLYYEDALTTSQRMIFFDYENDRELDYFDVDVMGLNSCIFNQRELENYFRVFGVEFVYMFDDVEPLPDDSFVQGRKVRHHSLINQDGDLEFSKVRHNSLINQTPTQVVKKVRHIL